MRPKTFNWFKLLSISLIETFTLNESSKIKTFSSKIDKSSFTTISGGSLTGLTETLTLNVFLKTDEGSDSLVAETVITKLSDPK